jgi:hypothetical protein
MLHRIDGVGTMDDVATGSSPRWIRKAPSLEWPEMPFMRSPVE